MKIERMVIVALALALMLTLGVRLGQAQVLGPVPMPESQVNRPAADLFDQIPIQGRLTDAGGNPLNGTYTVHFYIYDAASGGTLLCGNWTSSVTVTNGLFNSTIDLCDAAGGFKGDQLYLGVQVGSDPEMTPRQPILAVPYAYNLKKNATIKGADSYIFVPGSAFVKQYDTDTTAWTIALTGGASVKSGTTVSDKNIYIPITLPGQLYGERVTVESVTIFYKCENGTNNYISASRLYKATDADSYVTLVDSTTHQTSTTATSYTLTPTSNNVLSSGQGILNLSLGLHFVNSADYILIAGASVRLSHQY